MKEMRSQKQLSLRYSCDFLWRKHGKASNFMPSQSYSAESIREVAEARLQVVEYVLWLQMKFHPTLGAAIEDFRSRQRTGLLPTFLQDALRIAHVRKQKMRLVRISARTIFRWISLYKEAGNTSRGLEPKPQRKVPANDNIKD